MESSVFLRYEKSLRVDGGRQIEQRRYGYMSQDDGTSTMHSIDSFHASRSTPGLPFIPFAPPEPIIAHLAFSCLTLFLVPDSFEPLLT